MSLENSCTERVTKRLLTIFGNGKKEFTIQEDYLVSMSQRECGTHHEPSMYEAIQEFTLERDCRAYKRASPVFSDEIEYDFHFSHCRPK